MMLALLVTFTGCKKEEQPKPETQVQPAPQTPPAPVAPAVKVEGTWKGTFWNKAMTLAVTKQDGDKFEGETTVMWRTAVKSKISGTIDPATLTLKFADVEKTKDSGSYEGKLSADMKTFTGTFTLASNAKITYKVNLTIQ